jgi:RNA polymerase sigma-70 factor (ECF subfamily)
VLDEQGQRRLETAYRQIGSDLWRAVLVYAGGAREVADDAVAEAFAQAGRRLDSIRNLRPWLYKAAFRLAAGELARRTVELRAAESERPANPSGFQQEMELMELSRRLSPNQRAVFVLRSVFGYSGRETARLLGLSEVAVRVHLHGAKRRLRDLIMEANAP